MTVRPGSGGLVVEAAMEEAGITLEEPSVLVREVRENVATESREVVVVVVLGEVIVVVVTDDDDKAADDADDGDANVKDVVVAAG